MASSAAVTYEGWAVGCGVPVVTSKVVKARFGDRTSAAFGTLECDRDVEALAARLWPLMMTDARLTRRYIHGKQLLT
jgi:hypothetical protein